ncbi:antibiotic biosynthesis monooxygenase family protein [Streptomyces sp. NPDC101234]|uniref:antibiotic biosynthesis monooxygenase family protein n=1 Tax=Streptomyces sp. NPDC101234 TaxID=3366138 RepID=UPI00381B008C
MNDNTGPVTFINVFEMPAEQVDAFVARWRARAHIMGNAPGFLGTKLHRAMSSESRFQVINVARWASREAWEAAQTALREPGAPPSPLDDPAVEVSANPALYEVVADVGEPPDQAD